MVIVRANNHLIKSSFIHIKLVKQYIRKNLVDTLNDIKNKVQLCFVETSALWNKFVTLSIYLRSKTSNE